MGSSGRFLGKKGNNVCLSLSNFVFLIEMRKQSSVFSFQLSAKNRTLLIGFIFCLSLITYHLLLVAPAHAQLEIAETYDVADKDAQSGDILSLTADGFSRTKADYDSKMFGVMISNPLAVYRRVDGSGIPVSRNGVIAVNVTTANGEIKTGDYITSSTIPGKGQKAGSSGYVVGVALKDFKTGDGTEIEFSQFQGGPTKKAVSGQIPVAIKIEYAELSNFRNTNSLIEKLNAALFTNIKDPEKFVNVIRYISSGIVGILSIIIGLFILSRVIPKGVEGIARNPMARSSIIVYTALNIVVVIVIVLLGIGASLLLLRL